MKLLTAAIVLSILGGCGASRRDVEQLAEGSCEARCHTDHEDSLYDENRCREDCAPPE